MAIKNSGFNSVSLNTQIPKLYTLTLTTPPLLTNYSISTPQLNSYGDSDYARNLFTQRFGSGLNYDPSKSTGGSTGGGSIAPSLIGLGLNIGLDLLPSLFGDSEIGQSLGSVFGATTNSALNTMVNNVANGSSLLQGLGANAGSAAAGAAVGIGANYLGKGITSVLGGSNVAKGIGAGIASGVGRVGGAAVQNLAKTGKLVGTLGKINPYTLAANAIGEGLSTATGPSKEYGGEYGTAVQTADTIYDVTRTALGFVPVWGLIASAAMTLNKGLSNVFGSTDGQTLQDSILGTAFTPFFLKWLNMSGARTTDKFANQSWQNSEKATKFMQNSFGNLQDDFDAALKHAGKTYGLFSRSAYNKANEQVGRANNAWDRVLSMADLNEWQNIRGLVMNSINNQRYSLAILGGFNQIARGKMGMKIFNNLICHNANMRMLSAAALADDIIVSAQNGTKLLKEVVVTAPRKYIAGYDSNGNPIYTENPQESMGYTPTNPKADYDKGIQAIKDSEKPKYTDSIIKAAQLGIGVPLAVTTAPATLGTLFKASEPVMNILARPTTTATKVASRLFPSLSRALPYTEMADRGLMGYLGARGAYDAGKDWYNGTMPWYQAVPQMGLSGLMMADAAPVVNSAAKNLSQLTRRVWNGGNVIQRNIPYNPNNYYREVDKNAIVDAQKTGLIRGHPRGLEVNHPYFGRSISPWQRKKYVIEGYPESSDWISAYKYIGEYGAPKIELLSKYPNRDFSKGYATKIGEPQSNGFLLTGGVDKEFLSEYEAFPYYNGSTIVPTTKFTYWLKHPIIGWRNHSFVSRGSMEPTIPPENAANKTSSIIRTVQDNGKIRLSLPTHTAEKPRQFVLDPAGDNKFYVHMRTWDENYVPANLTNEDKHLLFDALYNELPEGAEILFPKSGPGYYGTRGTVAGLLRLARDRRFTPGTKGILQYLDKDGKTVRTYEGTSFIKTENGWQGNRYVLDLTTLEGILNFIDNDIIPRMLTQGHNISSYTPTFRQFSPKTDAFDEAMSKANSGSGAWFSPASNDITIRGPLEKQDFGLTIHEAGGHGLRYNMLPDYVPTKREYLNEYIITGGKDMSDEATNALLKVHTGDQIYNAIEVQKLRESYPWIKTYFERNPVKKSSDVVLRESGSVNTQFRSHYSNNGKIVGKELDEVINKASPGVVLRDLIEQPYTSSVVEDIAKITGKDPDALLFYGPEMLEKLVNQYPELLEIVSKVKDTMKTVGSYGVPITIGGSTTAALNNKSK